MSKESSTWRSPSLDRDVQLVRWGEVGRPVLIFSTAGGDAEEVERFHLIDALSELLEEERILEGQVVNLVLQKPLLRSQSTSLRESASLHRTVCHQKTLE